MRIDESDSLHGFVTMVSKKIPELKPLYDDHVEFNGEVLPHVLMDEYSRHVLEKYEAGTGHELLRKREWPTIRC
jgi:hypothetical protein